MFTEFFICLIGGKHSRLCLLVFLREIIGTDSNYSSATV